MVGCVKERRREESTAAAWFSPEGGRREKKDKNEARPGDQWQATCCCWEDNYKYRYGDGPGWQWASRSVGPMVGRVSSPAGISSALRVNGGLGQSDSPTAPPSPLCSPVSPVSTSSFHGSWAMAAHRRWRHDPRIPLNTRRLHLRRCSETIERRRMLAVI